MEMEISESNYDEEYCVAQKSSRLYLTHIVNLEGIDLTVAECLLIPETQLLQQMFYDDRKPDTQVGGECLGRKEYANIDKYFDDSVSALNGQVEIVVNIF